MTRPAVPVRYAKAAAKVDLKTKLAFMKSFSETKKLEDAAMVVGITHDAAWGILYRPPTPRQRCSHAAKALPKETRQAFLDLLKEGKTFDAASAQLAIDEDAAYGVLTAAVKTIKVMDWVAK